MAATKRWVSVRSSHPSRGKKGRDVGACAEPQEGEDPEEITKAECAGIPLEDTRELLRIVSYIVVDKNPPLFAETMLSIASSAALKPLARGDVCLSVSGTAARHGLGKYQGDAQENDDRGWQMSV